ncbi:DUF3575 domain-containing protein [Pedobacter insulae]|uniref:DUF3575 domain-containing protein n=1 Tax=Pedobacter insulae TaxID=414048 RepID=A0A1I3A6Q5_9SPHI|nr:DUF3575 domain-containing protein [Pedobacter insulae]SFH45546.1 hypothetical protein SAMN04489864_11334 [Pedobacter insulae]
MKKTFLIGLVSVLSFASYAQEADTLKKAIQKNAESIGHGGVNEIKFNLLYAILGMPEVSYERILADNMGVGASLFIGVDDKVDYKFGLTPHFRVYFGSQKANGFFIEANATVLTTNSYDYYAESYQSQSGMRIDQVEKNSTNFGMGASVGRKFLTRNGFSGEAFLGVGRLFGNRTPYVTEAYPRLGITLGKRF